MKTQALAFLVGLAHLGIGSEAAAQSMACAPRSAGEGSRIDEAGWVTLGGIEQWITFRGADRSNPVLLHVHGGPGFAFSAFAAEFAPYEADFTVVQWDQRGAGCTFLRHGEGTELMLERIAQDGVELALELQQRMPGVDIVVLGHSFGSVVATEMVLRAPDLFAAYVGTGQFVNLASTVDALVAYLREHAAATGDAALAAQLDEIARQDSRTLAKFGAVNRLLARRGPAVDMAFLQRVQARAAEVMSSEELAAWQAGRGNSGARLAPQLEGVDLSETVRRLDVPFVVIQGTDDMNTPTRAASTYFDRVAAPAKKLVVIDRAGHFPHLTHTDAFRAALAASLPAPNSGPAGRAPAICAPTAP